jgi:hypothetical protein
MGFKINKKNTSHQKYAAPRFFCLLLALLTLLCSGLQTLKKIRRRKAQKAKPKNLRSYPTRSALPFPILPQILSIHSVFQPLSSKSKKVLRLFSVVFHPYTFRLKLASVSNYQRCLLIPLADQGQTQSGA